MKKLNEKKKDYRHDPNYTPKIGDRVIITESVYNWNSVMDQYIGQVVTIASIVGREEYDVEFVSDEHPDINEWSWVYGHGHFRFFEVTDKKSLKIKLKF